VALGKKRGRKRKLLVEDEDWTAKQEPDVHEPQPQSSKAAGREEKEAEGEPGKRLFLRPAKVC
jgi:hypothetical protein